MANSCFFMLAARREPQKRIFLMTLIDFIDETVTDSIHGAPRPRRTGRPAPPHEHAMHFNRLDLNLLVALNVLLEEKNVTRAGERLHLSQSTMSSALARLRDYFQDDLLVPVGRRMTPTPLAEGLVLPVREILLKVEATVVTAQQAFDPATSTRHFKLLVSDYVVSVLINPALPRLQREAPGITIECLTHTESPWDALQKGDIDLLILPTQYTHEGHPSEVLFEDTHTCIAWQDNPLVGDTLSLDQYLELGHVSVNFGVTGRVPAYDEWFFRTIGHARKAEVVLAAFTAVPFAVVGTTRIATIHKRLADLYVRHLPLKCVAPPIDIPPLAEAAVWLKYRDQDAGLAWLRRMLKDAANGR